jgi:protein phosphatase
MMGEPMTSCDGTVMQSRGFGHTHVGQVRDNNEDAILVDDELGLYAVADGIGGHLAGEVAAQLALAVLSDSLTEERQRLERARRADDAEAVLTLAQELVERANRAVYESSVADETKHGMGCTLTALITINERVVIAHVGDSRALRIRAGQLEQLTDDHTIAQLLMSRGLLEGPPTFAFHHALCRAVGIESQVAVDVSEVSIERGDRFLLCSDGLTRYTEDPQQLAPLLEGEVAHAPTRLVDFANDAGGGDNVSVIVVDFCAA